MRDTPLEELSPQLELALLEKISRGYRLLADWSSALAPAQRAGELARQLEGEQSLANVRCLWALSEIHRNTRKVDKGARLAAKALSVLETRGDRTSLEYGEVLCELARYGLWARVRGRCVDATQAQVDRGQRHGSAALLPKGAGRAGAGRAAPLGSWRVQGVLVRYKQDRAYSHLLHGIALCYERLSDLTKALKYQLDACEAAKVTWNAEHPDFAREMENLGTLYFRLKRVSDSAAAFETSLAVYRKTLGESHTTTLKLIKLLGHTQDETADPFLSYRMGWRCG